MNLTQKQFEVLVTIERERKKLSQREISIYANLSLGTINNVINELLKEKLIDTKKV